MSDAVLRHLYVVLDASSRQRAASRARLPFVKCDHVTLAYGAPSEAIIGDYLDGDWREGDEVTLHVVAEYSNEDVQAWRVEIEGSARRKQDGGTLHVTISRSGSARSRDANALLDAGTPTPHSEVLRGTLRWVAASPRIPQPESGT